jgi:hypothetical protein
VPQIYCNYKIVGGTKGARILVVTTTLAITLATNKMFLKMLSCLDFIKDLHQNCKGQSLMI